MDTLPNRDERKRLAALAGIDEQYLYQCMTGRRDMEPLNAVRVEQSTGGAVRRWQVRIKDWWKAWPELIGAPGAPKVPTPKRGRRQRPLVDVAPAVPTPAPEEQEG